jgi:putative nucleotidyltransferase with HDIG domain
MIVLDEFISQVNTLPPAPRVLTQLLGLLKEHDVDCSRIVELITYDPALTAKVLQRCNNAAAGLAEPVHHLPDAVTRLGFNEIYRLVAVVIGKSTLGAAQQGYGMLTGELWRHSVVAAVAAKVVALTLGEDENLAFTAALLHDIGKLVLSPSVARTYPAVSRAIALSGHSFLEAEKSIIGVEHAEVGGRVLAQWNFPDNLVQAVWHHHDPIQARPYEQLAACVYVADMIAHFMGHGHGFQAHAVRGRGEALEILEITPREIESLIIETDTALKAANWFSTNEP